MQTRWTVLALLAAAFACATPAQAQLAGQKLGACPERVYLSTDQIAVAAAMSTVLDELDSQFNGLRGDDQIVAGMLMCARKIPYHVCTDPMLLGLLDPVGAAAGAAAGATVGIYNKGEPSLLGGLLGAGVLGMAKGVVDIGQCNKRFAMLKPAALQAFGGWQFDVGQVRGSEVRDRLAQAARTGRISAADAQTLSKFVSQTAQRLTQ
jgi:hypothetical protein